MDLIGGLSSELLGGLCDALTWGSVDNTSTRGIHVAIECLNTTK